MSSATRTAKDTFRWRKALRLPAHRAGISDLRWHDLRRSCGCRLVQDHGLSLGEVKEWLGQKSIVVTERAYAFLNMQKVKEKVRRPVAKIIPIQN